MDDWQASIRRHLVTGLLAVFTFAVIVGGWTLTTELTGAVIASGRLAANSNVKKVQHPTGGVLGTLNVRDGDLVRAGDVLASLDETQTRANLGIIVKALQELAARQARDEAERDGSDEIAFPPDLLALEGDPVVARLVAGERKLFELRRSARAGAKAQLAEQIKQLREEIGGLQEQLSGKAREIDWNAQELAGTREAWNRKLVEFTKIAALEQTAARLEGTRGQLVSSIAQERGKVAETELKILQVDQDMRTEVGKDLADIRAKTSELTEKRVAAEDLLRRVEIRAPQDGRVNQLQVHTIGGVVRPGDTLMDIVPERDPLIAEVRVRPEDIDQLQTGQRVVIRLVALNQRTTPELNGEVVLVAADATDDPRTGVSYYVVRVGFGDGEVERLGGLKLVSGMPLEAFVQTGSRTVLSYLVRPLHDQIVRAFREK